MSFLPGGIRFYVQRESREPDRIGFLDHRGRAANGKLPNGAVSLRPLRIARRTGGGHRRHDDIIRCDGAEIRTIGEIGEEGSVFLQAGGITVHIDRGHCGGQVRLPTGVEGQITDGACRDLRYGIACAVLVHVPTGELVIRLFRRRQRDRVRLYVISRYGPFRKRAAIKLIADRVVPGQFFHEHRHIHNTVAVAGVVTLCALVHGAGLQQGENAIRCDVLVIAQSQSGHSGDDRRGEGGSPVG